MMMSGLALLLLGGVILCVEVVRYRRKASLDPLLFFSVWFGFSYCIAPFIIALGGEAFAFDIFDARYIYTESVMAVVSIYLSYIFVVLGYLNGASADFAAGWQFRWRLPSSLSGWFLAVLVLIGIGAFAVFVVRYGGLSFVVRNISAIRSGHVERDTVGAVARMFTIFIDLSAWMLFAVLIQRRSRWLLRDVAMWALFGGLALLSLGNGLIGGGRGTLVFPFVMYYLTYVYVKGRPRIIYSILLGAVILFVVWVGKVAIFQSAYLGPSGIGAGVIEYAGGKGILDVVAEVSREFSHAYLSLRQAIESAGDRIELRWFVDIPLGILFYLGIFGMEVPNTITYLNTSLITGREASDIPPGIVGMWWYSAMLPGVIIGAVCYGVVGRVLKNVLIGLCRKSYGVPLFIYFSFMYGSFSFNGDLRVYVMKLFPLGVFLFLLMLGSLGISNEVGRRSLPQGGRVAGMSSKSIVR